MVKKFNKAQSLDEGEIVMETIEEAEVLAWSDNEPEQEPTDDVMEVEVSTVTKTPITEPTQADLKWAKVNLAGTPGTFDSESLELLQRLARYGIAADFGDEGYARGYKWPTI